MRTRSKENLADFVHDPGVLALLESVIIKMEAADDDVRQEPFFRPEVFDDVDDAGMGAAGDEDGLAVFGDDQICSWAKSSCSISSSFRMSRDPFRKGRAFHRERRKTARAVVDL
jgi:hypothetical protein